jgi:hypothetical protein
VADGALLGEFLGLLYEGQKDAFRFNHPREGDMRLIHIRIEGRERR